MMSDGELVRQALAGRTEAFELLVRQYAGRITALCHARVRRADVAEDLAQETFLRGYRALPTLADPNKIGPWLCGIAHRACLDWLKAKARTTVAFSALGPDHDPEEVAARTEVVGLDADEVHKLLAEVEALPDDYREVVMLYYYQDLTYRDLAALLGVSPATVNARLTKARALLRDRLTRGTQLFSRKSH
jgi:RNA polymerase sigma-70 factor, ECF subfamily